MELCRLREFAMIVRGKDLDLHQIRVTAKSSRSQERGVGLQVGRVAGETSTAANEPLSKSGAEIAP